MDNYGSQQDHRGHEFRNAAGGTSAENNQQILYVDSCFSHSEEELTDYLLPNNDEIISSRIGPQNGYNHSRNTIVSGNGTLLDQAKLDKKRERNRIAASKCRQRKLEKIQTLEEQVFRLKKENEELRCLSERLREGLDKTKAQLDFHHRSGCSVECPLLEPIALPPFQAASSVMEAKLSPPDSTCLS